MKGKQIGTGHKWNYIINSEFLRDGNLVQYQFKKKKGRQSKSYGGFHKGSKLTWGIQGKYNVKKVKNGYQVIISGNKRQLKVKIPKRRRFR